MIHTAWVFEEKWNAADCRVHDFGKLVILAGLTNELNARRATSASSGDRFDSNWGTVVAWKPESRYAPRTEADARNLFDAITRKPDGVLRWLKNYW
jgi:hypothetical protein